MAMARAFRVEYPGARYHLMCRGNQSRRIIEKQTDADLFVRTLGEMCVRNGAVVHAWCLMSNHYHLLLETPLGNLVDAMKWFQGTFTQRYNAQHKLWGHLFQGRYKAKLVDDTDPAYFRKVSEYIHLNPADAGLVKMGQLAEYPWSSYPLYLKSPSKRPDWLLTQKVLNVCGIRGDTSTSRRAYMAYINLKHQALIAEKRSLKSSVTRQQMERGWIYGSQAFRDRMLENLQEQGVTASAVEDREQKRDLSIAAADAVLKKCLTHFGLSRTDLPSLPKSDSRKMLIAGLLRYHYPVRVQWISENLSMGHFTTVSRAMRFYDDPEDPWKKEKQCILKFIG